MIITSITHPAVIGTSLLSAAVFGSWFTFWNKSNLARTEKERAYVCTLLSSSITSTCSLPLVYQLLTNGGDISEIAAYRTWTVLLTTFFMTFLYMDLAIGVVYYRNKIDLLTGWIHHITYLGTLTWAIHKQYSSIFIMMCVLEIPTFLLALGSVRSQLRRDYLFATTFLLTRILFHAFAISSAWKLQAFGPIVNALSSFFPVHCFWFYGFIKQQIRLAKKKNVLKASPISTQAAPVTENSSGPKSETYNSV
ncbi:unnamed protein product [Mucor hiemalis]